MTTTTVPNHSGAFVEAGVEALLAYREAANLLTVGQTSLQANPLLREPVHLDQIKLRLLGHCRPSPAPARMIATTGDDVLRSNREREEQR